MQLNISRFGKAKDFHCFGEGKRAAPSLRGGEQKSFIEPLRSLLRPLKFEIHQNTVSQDCFHTMSVTQTACEFAMNMFFLIFSDLLL